MIYLDDLKTQYKNLLASRNINYDLSTKDNFFDIEATVICSIVQELYNNLTATETRLKTENFTYSTLLEMLQRLGLEPRYTGTFANGYVQVEKTTVLPVTLTTSDYFTYNDRKYYITSDVVLNEEHQNVKVTAENSGVAYNLNNGLVMTSSSSLILVAKSFNIAGGAGEESDGDILERVLTYLQNPLGIGLIDNYIREVQKTANVGYISVRNLLKGDVQYGVEVFVGNRISDFELAATSKELVIITPTQAQLDLVRTAVIMSSPDGTYLALGSQSVLDLSTYTSNIDIKVLLFPDNVLSDVENLRLEIATNFRKHLLNSKYKLQEFNENGAINLYYVVDLPYLAYLTYNEFKTKVANIFTNQSVILIPKSDIPYDLGVADILLDSINVKYSNEREF